MQQYLWKYIYTLYFIRIKSLYLYDKVIFNFLLYTLFYKGSILHVFLHSWDIISNVVYVLGHGGEMNFYFTLYIKWGSIKIKLTSQLTSATYKQLEHWYGLSSATIWSYRELMKGAYSKYMEVRPVCLGGPDVVVEID